MSLASWLRHRVSTRHPHGGGQPRPAAFRCRPRLQVLEGRALPSTYYAATAADLIADVNAANKGGGANTIILTAPTTSPYMLGVNNTTDGANALPVIAGATKKVAADNLTIAGNGDTIERSTQTYDCRLFDVASGASLTLENAVLAYGVAGGAGTAAEGGAVRNQGTLVLNQVWVVDNTASGMSSQSTLSKNGKQGSPSADVAGGGIWSNGSLTVSNSTFEANVAENDFGGPAYGGAIAIAGGTVNITDSAFGDPNGGGGLGNTAKGQTAYGGAVYVAAGTVTMSGDTFGNVNAPGLLAGNSALGGFGSATAGDGYGGAIYIASGSVTLTNDSIVGNYVADLDNPDGAAFGDNGGYGGGIYIAYGATVYINSFTVNNTVDNFSNYPMDIDGPYQLLP